MATAREAVSRPVGAGTSNELSGIKWVGRFPTSMSLEELDQPFRKNVKSLIDAVNLAGGRVSIAATYRPKERAYLMHYASAIATGMVKAESVPAMAGVNIEWVHEKPEQSKAAAREMAAAYAIVFPPALESRHTARNAIDMSISGLRNKKISDASGKEVLIKKDSDLVEVARTYSVIKLLSDPPHWSDNGF